MCCIEALQLPLVLLLDLVQVCCPLPGLLNRKSKLMAELVFGLHGRPGQHPLPTVIHPRWHRPVAHDEAGLERFDGCQRRHVATEPRAVSLPQLEHPGAEPRVPPAARTGVGATELLAQHVGI